MGLNLESIPSLLSTQGILMGELWLLSTVKASEQFERILFEIFLMKSTLKGFSLFWYRHGHIQFIIIVETTFSIILLHYLKF